MKKKKSKQTISFYNNIENVRNIGLSDIDIINSMKLDLRHCIDEIKKCSEDPIYFIENYVYIVTTDKGIQKFKLREYQKEIIKAYENNRYVIIKIGRQLGKTTLSAAYFYWLSLFNKNFGTLILANKQEIAIETIDRIKIMIQYTPLWLQTGISKLNETTIKFENGSRIKASATTKSSGRGTTFNIVYVDEMAHIEENITTGFMESVFPVISSGNTTKFFTTSTPKGLNTFWKIFNEAQQGVNDFFYLEFDWNVDGIRDEEFKQTTIAKHGERHFNQEYKCEFLGSAGTLLESDILKKLSQKTPIEIKKIYKNKYQLKIYVQPKNNRNYIVTVDPSEGLGKDYTGIHVWDVSDSYRREQVAVFYNNSLSITEAPYVIKEICKLYNMPLVIMENNKFEGILKDLMISLDYDKIFWYGGKKGVYMTQSSRNLGLKQMIIEFENNRIVLNDFDTIHELSTFVEKNGKYQADQGYYDDLVTSMNLLCWLMADKDRYKRYIEDVDSYIKDVHKIDAKDEDLYMFIDNGIKTENWFNNNKEKDDFSDPI